MYLLTCCGGQFSGQYKGTYQRRIPRSVCVLRAGRAEVSIYCCPFHLSHLDRASNSNIGRTTHRLADLPTYLPRSSVVRRLEPPYRPELGEATSHFRGDASDHPGLHRGGIQRDFGGARKDDGLIRMYIDTSIERHIYHRIDLWRCCLL